jgi:hypothetical protein
MFDLLPAGFSKPPLRVFLAQLLGQLEETHDARPNEYHLRRLRLQKTHRYRLTDLSLRTAQFCTRRPDFPPLDSTATSFLAQEF